MVRWGILGCGAVTEVKSGPALQHAHGSALVAVMRRDAAKAADYARRHGVPRWYDDAAALIADPEVDAVYIATPPSTHCELALAVCAAGKPAYVEKPMARTHGECQRMLAAFGDAGVPLFVAHYRRALPRFLTARALVAGGRLGAVTGVSCRYVREHARMTPPEGLGWRVEPEHAGGGLFVDLGSHTLDVLDFLLGPLEHVAGLAANVAGPYEAEDTVTMAFATASGALGTASWIFSGAVHEDLIELHGTDGQLALSTFGDEPLRLTTAAGLEEIACPTPAHVQQPLIQAVVDELHGRGTCPSTGVTAARTCAVIDAVLAGYYGSRDPGFWQHPEQWPGRRREAVGPGLTGCGSWPPSG